MGFFVHECFVSSHPPFCLPSIFSQSHRDLKAANIKITPDGKIKILDCGLAKALTPLLFEMLTARSAFEGRTVSDVLAGVLRTELEWSLLPRNLHPRLRELLERCLEKKAQNR